MKNKIQNAIITHAELYDRKLSIAAVAMMADDLSDLSESEVLSGLAKYRRDPNARGFPTAGQIRSLARPDISEDGTAREAASKIVDAMIRYGHNQQDRAREFMGEVAWRVVQMEGGWQHVCETTSNDDLPMLKSQWRELAKVALVRVTQDKKALETPSRESFGKIGMFDRDGRMVPISSKSIETQK